MSEPRADSAPEPGEATGATPTTAGVADSTPTPAADGQEQGDQSESKRVNDLMSIANKRLGERDQALSELEDLKAQLAAREMEAQENLLTSFDPASMDVAEGDAGDGDDAGGDDEAPEPRIASTSPARPDYRQQPTAPADYSTPAARYARESSDIAAMQQQLRDAGARWYEGQREQGLID